MHCARKADLLAASQDALNRSQARLLSGSSQASYAFALPGFFCRSLCTAFWKRRFFYSTGSDGGMHRACKANFLAMSQDMRNRSQAQLLSGSSQVGCAFALPGFFCHTLRPAFWKRELFHSTRSVDGMHRACKADFLAASQDARNRSQARLLPGSSQASHAFALPGFFVARFARYSGSEGFFIPPAQQVVVMR